MPEERNAQAHCFENLKTRKLGPLGRVTTTRVAQVACNNNTQVVYNV